MLLTIIFISLLMTFYFSGTETAFISVNNVRIELWRRQDINSGVIISKLLKDPEKFIYTTLVGNNIANIAFASYATIYFRDYLNETATWLLVTAITVIWGEILPKTLFRSLADWVIIRVAPILMFFYYLFYPMIWVVHHISKRLLIMFGETESEVNEFFSKKDVEILMRESTGQLDAANMENEIIVNVLQLHELWVRDAMIPHTEIVAVHKDASIAQLSKIFQKSGFTKVPVFDEGIDDIVGVAMLKDLFLLPESLSEIIREVMFVPEAKKSSELLREFREKNASIAIVVDEYGGTAGLVTQEDLLEELVGEIVDEYDATLKLIRKTDDFTFSVNARIELEELQEQLGLQFPAGEHETLAGFVLSQLGHIPRRDEQFIFNNAQFMITRATRRKIETVRISLPRP